MIFIKISKKIWLSFLKFVLLTALIHIGVLIFTSIKKGNIKFLNYFQILGLTEFWPKITKGWVSDLISILIMASIVGGFLTISLIKKKTAEIKNN
jgi:energy-coupling factor transporter transmembrane protein EcfT